MKRFWKVAGAAAAALMTMAAMTACTEKENGKPDSDDGMVVTMLVSESTKTVVEGAVTVTFQPSGKQAKYSIAEAAAIPDKTLFQVFNSDLKMLFGEEQTRKFWSEMVSMGGHLSGEPGDTRCVISRELKPKAGLSLTDSDKYDVVLGVDYKYNKKASSTSISTKGMMGSRLEEWCTEMSKFTTTIHL